MSGEFGDQSFLEEVWPHPYNRDVPAIELGAVTEMSAHDGTTPEAEANDLITAPPTTEGNGYEDREDGNEEVDMHVVTEDDHREPHVNPWEEGIAAAAAERAALQQTTPPDQRTKYMSLLLPAAVEQPENTA